MIQKRRKEGKPVYRLKDLVEERNRKNLNHNNYDYHEHENDLILGQ
jgi:hypothetical protein